MTSSTRIAHLQIHLKPRDDYPRFRIALRTGRGEKVLTRDNLQRSRHAGGYAIQFDVPASALAAGDYELELRGARRVNPRRTSASTISEWIENSL